MENEGKRSKSEKRERDGKIDNDKRIMQENKQRNEKAEKKEAVHGNMCTVEGIKERTYGASKGSERGKQRKRELHEHKEHAKKKRLFYDVGHGLLIVTARARGRLSEQYCRLTFNAVNPRR